MYPHPEWFLGPARVCPPPDGISIGSAVFTQLTGTDTQTDHAMSR